MSSEKKGKLHEVDISHSMTHYLLTIHKLKEERGYARVTDIAKSLDLTKGSVSTAINNLKKRNLVSEEEDSKFLVLTELGHDEVHKILSSRTLMYYFLKDFVGVDASTADHDSCVMEHLMSIETLEKLFVFMKGLSGSEKERKKVMGQISSSLDLGSYNSPKDFIEDQKGDKYLQS